MDVVPQVAFCIIKLDAIERGLVGEILTRVERTHMRLLSLQERHKSEEWAHSHYAHLKDEPFFPELVKFMTTSPLISFNVVGVDSIARMRKLAGPTDSKIAPPGTIRGDFGTHPVMYNCIHVSESPEAADRERAFWYDHSTDIVVRKTPPQEEG